MTNKENKKRIELGVNTQKVKVQFNTSTTAFREVMGKYWVAVVEMADMTKVYANNVRILSESVEKLQNKEELTHAEKTRLDLDSAQLTEYTEKFSAYKSECDTRFKECYDLVLTSELYQSYVAYATSQDKASFEVALRLFLKEHNIESNKSVMDFLLSVVGMRTAPANTKVKSKGTTLLIAQTEKRFNELFMHALAQLMVDKNCIKTDLYTFTYEKGSITHIDSKIDNVEVPQEQEQESQTESKVTGVTLDEDDEAEPQAQTEAPQETQAQAEEQTEQVDYNSLPVVELKKLAKSKGVAGYSKMKKQELIEALTK